MTKRLLYILIAIVALLGPVHSAKAQFYSVYGNGLALMTGTINVGMEIALAKKVSFDVGLIGNPIKTKDLSLFGIAIQPGAHFWLRQVNYSHFFGVHLTVGTYDVGNAVNRFKGFGFGVGGSWGYSWAIKKRFNIQVELGLSLLYLTDKTTDNTTPADKDLYIYHSNRIAVAPTKCAVNFVYLF